MMRVHIAAGIVSLLSVTGLWSATAVGALSGDMAFLTGIERTVPWGFVVLIPALLAAGVTGQRIAGGWASLVLRHKLRRMRLALLITVLILLPASLALAHLASIGAFAYEFLLEEAVALSFGALTICLLAMNARDGVRLLQGELA
jgi:hypothetical protein